jgi:hypothetical protein
MIRRRRPNYPQWDDERRQQAIASASLCWFGEDLGGEILNEMRHRQRRTGNPGRPPQPWPDADIKVWQRWAEARGNQELLAHLKGVERAHRGTVMAAKDPRRAELDNTDRSTPPDARRTT